MDADLIYIESISLAPFSTIADFYDPSNYFREDIQEHMEESWKLLTEGTTKQNIFKRLWNTIVRCFKWIAAQFMRLIKWIGNGIKSVFGKGGKTADDAAEEVGLKPNEGAAGNSPKERTPQDARTPPAAPAPQPTPAPAAAPPRNKTTPAASPQAAKPQAMAPKKVPVKLDVKVDKGVEPPPNEIELAVKTLRVKIENGGRFFMFTPVYVENHRYDYSFDTFTGNDKAVPGPWPLSSNRMKWNVVVLAFATNETLMNELKDILARVSDGLGWDNGTAADHQQEIQKLFDDTMKFMDETDKICWTYQSGGKSIGATIGQLTKAGEVISEISTSISKYDDPTLDWSSKDPKMVQILNTIADLAWKMQFSMNEITTTMAGVYTIDPKYLSSCHDIDTLGNFVEQMVRGGIPPKFIAYNAILVADWQLRGTTNKNKPKLGQSRIAFFPSDQSAVHKVAFNNEGKRSNQLEVMIYKALCGNDQNGQPLGGEGLLAAVKGISKNGYVITLERVDCDAVEQWPSDKRDIMAGRVEHAIRNIAARSNLKVKIDDIHGGNIAVNSKGNVVAVDYGSYTR